MIYEIFISSLKKYSSRQGLMLLNYIVVQLATQNALQQDQKRLEFRLNTHLIVLNCVKWFGGGVQRKL